MRRHNRQLFNHLGADTAFRVKAQPIQRLGKLGHKHRLMLPDIRLKRLSRPKEIHEDHGQKRQRQNHKSRDNLPLHQEIPAKSTNPDHNRENTDIHGRKAPHAVLHHTADAHLLGFLDQELQLLAETSITHAVKLALGLRLCFSVGFILCAHSTI